MVFIVDGFDTTVDCFGDVSIQGNPVVGMVLDDLEDYLGLPDSREDDYVDFDSEWVLTTCTWNAHRIRCYAENGSINELSFEDYSR